MITALPAARAAALKRVVAGADIGPINDATLRNCLGPTVDPSPGAPGRSLEQNPFIPARILRR